MDVLSAWLARFLDRLLPQAKENDDDENEVQRKLSFGGKRPEAYSVEIPRLKRRIASVKKEIAMLERYQQEPAKTVKLLDGKATSQVNRKRPSSEFLFLRREQLRYWENRLLELSDPDYLAKTHNELELARKARVLGRFAERVPSPSRRTMILMCAPRVLSSAHDVRCCWLRILPLELLKVLHDMLYAPMIVIEIRRPHALDEVIPKRLRVRVAFRGTSLGQSLMMSGAYPVRDSASLTTNLRFVFNQRRIPLHLSPDEIGLTAGDVILEEDPFAISLV